MGLFSFIQVADKNIADLLAGKESYFSISPHRYGLVKKLKPVINKYASGRLLDLGAGRLAYRPYLEKVIDRYVSSDYDKTHPEIDVVADAKDLPFSNDEFDTVFCSQVLEHVDDSNAVIKQIYRVLRKDGYCLLSAPHISHIHNAPHDYYRFTEFGLRTLFENNFFEVEKIIPAGSILSFILTFPSKIFISLFYRIPILRNLVFFLNSINTKLITYVDDVLFFSKIMTLDYIVVARKKR